MAPDPRRAKELFHAALGLPGPAGRPAFLDSECGDDPELRARLDELLAAHDHPAEALGRPLAGCPGETTDFPVDDPYATRYEPGGSVEVAGAWASFRPEASGPPPDSVLAGRYRILREIGEGGMGSVYLAEQAQPVRRQVALKLIKPGMDSRAVLARFDSERQALALMDHPHIAKVFDAGTTEAGRPFFVMELVKGVPLTEYCDAHRLDLPARLALFRQVCHAVQHAHQKGVIHRDLKPSNVLVESHDGRPVPKVIDFGLAKATSGIQLGDHSVVTAFGSVAGTPLYMAPEQASFNAEDVDTRADIYALGVILYELLTGSTPIRRDTLRRAALDEMLRVIREDEPPTPSSRISNSEGLASIAATRLMEPSRLSRFVRGDLDWIVMKALAKDRERRYDSAIGLADDVERFTNHEPVGAGPPTATYRFRKFARRNRPQMIAASLVLLALAGGIVGTTIGLFEARRQERRAVRRLGQVEKANEILGSIFKDLDPGNAEQEGKPLAAILGERLDQATAQIEGEAIGDPLAVARMQMTLGLSQLGLGYPEKAIGLFTRCRATFASLLGPDHPDTLISMNSLAEGYRAAGQPGRALPLLEETLALRKAKLGPDHPDTITSMSNLALGYWAAGQLGRALPLLEEALTLSKAKRGPGHPDTLTSINNLASGYHAAGQPGRALPLLEEALSLRKARLGPDHPDTITSINNLASGYHAAGQPGRALPLLEEALSLRKARLGPDHPDTLTSMENLAEGYRAAGQPGRALPLLVEALARFKARLGPDHPDTLTCMSNLAGIYWGAGLADRALPLYEEALSLRRSKLGPDHPDTITSMSSLAGACWGAGHADRALPLLREVADRQRRKAGSDSLPYDVALGSLASVLFLKEKWADAEPILRELLAIRGRREPDAWMTFSMKSGLGWALFGQGKYTEAAPLLVAGYEGMKARADKIPPDGGKFLVEALDRLVRLAEATGKPDEARAWRDEKAKLPAPPASKPGAGKP